MNEQINLDQLSQIDDVVIPDEGVETPQPQGTNEFGAPQDPPANEDTPTDEVEEIKPEVAAATDDLLDESLEENQEEVQKDPDAEVFTGVAEILKGQGFFADVDKLDEVTSADKLAELFDKEVQARLTDQQRQLQQYMNQGVPVSEVQKVDKALQETNAITPEALSQNAQLAETLIRAELQNKNLDEGTVNMVVESIKSKNSLVEEAGKALEARKANLSSYREKIMNDAAAAREAQINKAKEQQQKIEKALESKEVFGRKVSPTSVEKLKKLASTPVAYTPDGRPLNALMKYQQDNPVDFEHKLMYLFSATNGFKDLKSFDRSAESRVTQGFRTAVMKTRTNSQDTLPETTKGLKFNPEDITDIV